MKIELNVNQRHIIKRSLKNRIEDLRRASERLKDDVPSVSNEFLEMAGDTEVVLNLIIRAEKELYDGTNEIR